MSGPGGGIRRANVDICLYIFTRERTQSEKGSQKRSKTKIKSVPKKLFPLRRASRLVGHGGQFRDGNRVPRLGSATQPHERVKPISSNFINIQIVHYVLVARLG